MLTLRGRLFGKFNVFQEYHAVTVAVDNGCYITQGVHADILLEVGMNKGEVLSVLYGKATLGKKGKETHSSLLCKMQF